MPAAIEPPTVQASPTGLVAAAAAVRGAAVAASGLILATGLALLVWALTPASSADAGAALRGGVVGFAAANLMPVSIGGVTLTLPPLLLTIAIGGLLAATARRGRFLPAGRYQESVSVLVTAAVYGLVVAMTTRGLGPPGAIPAGWVWTATALALLAGAAVMLRRGSAWHDWWIVTAADWVRCGVHGAGIGLGVLIAGGGLALSVGLIAHFGSAVAVSAIAAPSWMDGLGLTLLSLAYLPNAAVAGIGYLSGVGFEIGPGTYSPFASSPVDLPAVPLFTAAPDLTGRSWVGLAFLVVPVIAGYLVAVPAIRQLLTRSERVLGAAAGGVLTGLLVAFVTAVARGGVGGGRWSAIGAPPLLVGAVIVVEVGVVASTFAALSGGDSVPWRKDTAAPGRERGVAPRGRTGRRGSTGPATPAEALTDDTIPGRAPDDSIPDDSIPDDPIPDDQAPDDAEEEEPADTGASDDLAADEDPADADADADSDAGPRPGGDGTRSPSAD